MEDVVARVRGQDVRDGAERVVPKADDLVKPEIVVDPPEPNRRRERGEGDERDAGETGRELDGHRGRRGICDLGGPSGGDGPPPSHDDEQQQRSLHREEEPDSLSALRKGRGRNHHRGGERDEAGRGAEQPRRRRVVLAWRLRPGHERLA